MQTLTRTREVEPWKPPKLGWWKINCDVAFKTDNAIMAMVIRDDSGLLVEAATDIFVSSSAFETEAKVVDYAISHAASKG